MRVPPWQDRRRQSPGVASPVVQGFGSTRRLQAGAGGWAQEPAPSHGLNAMRVLALLLLGLPGCSERQRQIGAARARLAPVLASVRPPVAQGGAVPAPRPRLTLAAAGAYVDSLLWATSGHVAGRAGGRGAHR